MEKSTSYCCHTVMLVIIAVCGLVMLVTPLKVLGQAYEDACECWDSEGCACSEDYDPSGDYTFDELYACESVPQCSLIVCNQAYVCSLFNEGVTYEELVTCVEEFVDLSQSGLPAGFFLAFALQQCNFSIEEILAAGLPPCYLMLNISIGGVTISCEVLDYVTLEGVIPCFTQLIEDMISSGIGLFSPELAPFFSAIINCSIVEQCDIPPDELGVTACDLMICEILNFFLQGGPGSGDLCDLIYDATFDDLVACSEELEALIDLLTQLGQGGSGSGVEMDPLFMVLSMLMGCSDVPLNDLLDFGMPPCLLTFMQTATSCSLYDKGVTPDDYTACAEEVIPLFGDQLGGLIGEEQLLLISYSYSCQLLQDECVTLDSLLTEGVPPCFLLFCGVSACSTYKAGASTQEILTCFDDVFTEELLALLGSIFGGFELDIETLRAFMSCDLYQQCDIPLEEMLGSVSACSLLKCVEPVPVCSLIKSGVDLGELMSCEVHACSIYKCDPTTLCDLISDDVPVGDLLECGAPACSIYKCDSSKLCALLTENAGVGDLLECGAPACSIYKCDSGKLCDLVSENVPVSELLKCPIPPDPCDIYDCDPTKLCDLVDEDVAVGDLLNCSASACDIYTCDGTTLPDLITQGQACDLYSPPCEVPLCDLIDEGAQPAALLACLDSPCELCDCDVADVCPHLTPGDDCDGDFGLNGDECNGGTDPCVFDDRDDDTVSVFFDNCPDDPNHGQEDGDVDGVGDVCDNCPAVYNPGQEDFNDDGIGNHCQDSDDDGVLD
ncbi:MAG: hypothetical protein JSV84_13015, partial [Gemmatimonadota bacterium]